MRVFWWASNPPNFGDEIAPIILEYFTRENIEWVSRETPGKWLTVGSLIHCLREGDTVWGTGYNKDYPIKCPPGVRFLVVRGPLTKKAIVGGRVLEVYGDPGLLMPLIYYPKIEKTSEVGVVPHYVDREYVKLEKGQKLIDVQSGWRNVLDEMLKCNRIVASSMHAMIVAEAYGIPVIWEKYGERIQNQEMKGRDYFLGTGRQNQPFGEETKPILNLGGIQRRLLKALWSNL